MIRICFLHAGLSQHGGIGRVVSIILNGLSKHTNLALFSLEYSGNSEVDVYNVKKKIKRDILFSKNITMKQALLSGAVKEVVNYIQNNSIDIIVACGALYYPLARLAGKKCKIKTICWEHTNPTVNTDYNFQRLARWYGMKFSTLNIVISKSALNYYNSHCLSKKNVLIYNPAADELFINDHIYNINSNNCNNND